MVTITWLGHSAVRIAGSKTIIIDPFITGNPASSVKLADLGHVDLVFVTHDHGDHIGDAFAVCKLNGATLVAIHEISVVAQAEGIKAEGMNIGGSVELDGIKFHMVSAVHSASTGTAAGVVIELDGRKLYHAGDTALTYDMKLIGELFQPDLSFLPIGDRYTMGVDSAAKAVEFVQTKRVIPIHYNTFPAINSDPEKFKSLVGNKAEVAILSPGQDYNL